MVVLQYTHFNIIIFEKVGQLQGSRHQTSNKKDILEH